MTGQNKKQVRLGGKVFVVIRHLDQRKCVPQEAKSPTMGASGAEAAQDTENEGFCVFTTSRTAFPRKVLLYPKEKA